MTAQRKLFILTLVCLLCVSIFSANATMKVTAQESGASDPIESFALAGAQVCDDVNGDYALRFGFDLGCTNVTSDDNANTVIGEGAKVRIGGQLYPLLSFGAILALDHESMDADSGMDVVANAYPVINEDNTVAYVVPAEKLYSVNDNGTVTYTVRVTDLTAGEDHRETLVYVKGYVQYRDGDQVKTHTTDVYSGSYQRTFFAANSLKEGDMLDAHLQLIEVTTNLTDYTGTMLVKNTSSGLETDVYTAYVRFTCYDAEDVKLDTVQINLSRIDPRCQRRYSFTMPEGTYKMTLTECYGNYHTAGWH